MLPTICGRKHNLLAHRGAFISLLAHQLHLHRVRSLRKGFAVLVLPHLLNADVDRRTHRELRRRTHPQFRVLSTTHGLVDNNIAMLGLMQLSLHSNRLTIPKCQRGFGDNAERGCVLLHAFFPDVRRRSGATIDLGIRVFINLSWVHSGAVDLRAFSTFNSGHLECAIKLRTLGIIV